MTLMFFNIKLQQIMVQITELPVKLKWLLRDEWMSEEGKCSLTEDFPADIDAGQHFLPCLIAPYSKRVTFSDLQRLRPLNCLEHPFSLLQSPDTDTFN